MDWLQHFVVGSLLHEFCGPGCFAMLQDIVQIVIAILERVVNEIDS
jgi:hypothetical protein